MASNLQEKQIASNLDTTSSARLNQRFHDFVQDFINFTVSVAKNLPYTASTIIIGIVTLVLFNQAVVTGNAAIGAAAAFIATSVMAYVALSGLEASVDLDIGDEGLKLERQIKRQLEQELGLSKQVEGAGVSSEVDLSPEQIEAMTAEEIQAKVAPEDVEAIRRYMVSEEAKKIKNAMLQTELSKKKADEEAKHLSATQHAQQAKADTQKDSQKKSDLVR